MFRLESDLCTKEVEEAITFLNNNLAVVDKLNSLAAFLEDVLYTLRTCRLNSLEFRLRRSGLQNDTVFRCGQDVLACGKVL